MVYFRDRAKELGCDNVDDLGDLAVWEYIIANQSVNLDVAMENNE